MKKNYNDLSQHVMTLLSYLAIGLCGYKLSLIVNSEIHPELALAVVLALISKGRTIYGCVLGSLLLQCVLAIFNNLGVQAIAVTSALTGLGTLVYCRASVLAIRSVLDTRWRDPTSLLDFIKLLAISGLLTSLIPAAASTITQEFLNSTLSLKLLSLAFMRTWLDISTGSIIFLPVFLGILLRNAPAWRGRWKGVTIASLVLIGFASYINLTGREFEGLLARAQLKEQIGSITSLANKNVTASEEAVINFAQIANVQSADSQPYLAPLAQRIFSHYPAIRSLSVMIDRDLAEHETYKFSNPNYPSTAIDPNIISHYANAKTNPNPQLAPQGLQRFNLVSEQENGVIVSYQVKRISDPWSLKPTASADDAAVIYIEIDSTRFAPPQIMGGNEQQTWVTTRIQTARSSLTTGASTQTWLRPAPAEGQVVSFKIFDQTATLQASLTPAGRADQLLQLTLPLKLIKLLMGSIYLTAIFVIFTRKNRVRLLISRQVKTLERRDAGLNLFKNSIEQSHEAIAILRGDRDDPRIMYANKTFGTLSGYSEQELIGKDWAILIDYPVNHKELAALRKAITQGGTIRTELMAFNQTAQWFWIELSMTPIHSLNVVVPHWVLIQQNISDRKRAELEMRQATIDARDVSVAKSRFLANMSHEIRTPLSGIIGLSNLAQQTSDPKAIQKYLNTIQISAQLQLEIITSLLTTLKLEIGQTQLNLKPLELKTLLNQTADIIRPNATLKNISLNVKISNNVPEYIESDSVFLRQIMLNLASNAIKFTMFGTVNIIVEFVSQRDQTVRLRFSVEDSGPGLGSLSLTQITKPFSKGSIQNELNNEGLGLGLAIVESFLKLMGSHVQVKNINALGGATFYFELDCRFRSLDTENATQQIEPVETEIENPEWSNTFHNLRFLLIEDNLINQIVVQGYLQNSGAHVESATTGASALSKLSSTRYDLVLLDLRIPNFDTSSISAQLKNNPINSDVPIIGISASQLEDYQITLERYGLRAFLPKPIEQRLLFEAIKKCLCSETATVGPIKDIQNLTVFSERVTGQAEKLKGLFLKQALSLRPKIESGFFSNEQQTLMDSLHLLQGSAAAIADLDLQQAALEFENAIRTHSSDVEQFLNFVQVFDQSIDRTRQQLKPLSALATPESLSNTVAHQDDESRHINVLLVDDNELVCEALGNQIMGQALSVDFAHNSEEALLKLDTNRYDIVLSDLVLPDIDGLALSKMITSQSRFNGQIIFGLSAQVSEAITQECLNAGMKSLYSKLVDPSELLLALVDTVGALQKDF